MGYPVQQKSLDRLGLAAADWRGPCTAQISVHASTPYTLSIVIHSSYLCLWPFQPSYKFLGKEFFFLMFQPYVLGETGEALGDRLIGDGHINIL